MSLISEERYQELLAEARGLIREIKAEGTSLGESQLVVYEEDFATEHEISTIGRVTLSTEGLEYSAGPLYIERDCPYEADTKNFIGFMKTWVSGEKLDFDVTKWVARSKPPTFPDRGQEKAQTYEYERNLFDHMRRQGLEITVVNPSMKTLQALLRTGGCVTFSAQKTDERWYEEVRSFCSQSRDRIILLPEKTVRGHAYLGSGSPKWYPDESPWLYLCPNPYSRSRLYRNHEFKERDGVVEFVSLRSGREVVSLLLDNPHFFYHNPQTVDYHLKMKGDMFPYYLACKVPYFSLDLATSHVPHTPFFLRDLPPYEKVGGYEVSRSGYEVFDIKESGTYLSRRSMIPLPEGHFWTPLVAHGPYMVTRYSTFPLAVPDVRFVRSHIVFGYDTVVLAEPPEKVTDMIVNQSEVPFGKTSLLGYFRDYPLFKFEGTDDEKRNLMRMGAWLKNGRAGQVLDDVVLTSTGIYLRESASSFSGFAVQPRVGRQIACSVKLGDIYKLKVYYDGAIAYLSLPPDLALGSWIFSCHDAVAKYLPQIFLFSKMWVNSNDIFRVDMFGSHQVASRRSTDMLSTFMRTVNRATISEILTGAGLGLPMDSLFQAMTRIAGIYWWEGLSVKNAEFVTETFLSQKFFPMSEPMGNFFSIDGKSYLQVLEHLHRRGHACLYSRVSSSIRRLSRFLRGNPYTVQSLRRYPQYYELSVKAFRW
jgi:hypothetical protein